MSAENGYSLCVFCCCSFGQNCDSDAAIYRTDVTNFLKLLLTSPPQRGKQQKGDEKCIADLEQTMTTSGLSVCADCHAFVTSALETRSRAEQMEINVRKMQMEILEQLRVLGSEMDLFHQEMSKIENVVKTSDESCLKFHIPRLQNARNSKGNGVMVLRERILDVVTDLRIYQVNCGGDANIPVDESELEAMWDDAQQLVQCTPDISLDDQQLPSNSSGKYMDDCNDSSGGGADGEDNYMVKEINESSNMEERYMGHSVGTEFYMEGESDTISHRSLTSAPNPNFKTEVIQRALAREQNRNPQCNTSTDPLRRYFLKYDPRTDNLIVGNVEVTINVADETLQCSKCSIMGKRQKSTSQQKQNWRDMEKGIVVHIIGKHLGGFTCAMCREVFTSHTMIKKHFSKEHAGQTVTSAVSDDAPPIPHSTPGPVTHKTPMNPRKPYVCSMCSHSFGKPSQLKRHFIAKHAKSALEAAATKTTTVTVTNRPCPASKKKVAPPPPEDPLETFISPTLISPEKAVPLKSKLRPHECHICKYAFTKGSHLKRHFEVHRKRKEMV